MKKLILSIALFLTVFSLTAFASGEKNINPQVLRSFKTEFSGAQNVAWSKSEDGYRVNFTQNSFRVEAYFDESGELLGTVRNILFSELPLSVTSTISRKYQDAAAYEIFEYTVGNDTFYRMKVDLPGKTLQVRCDIAGGSMVEKRIKK